MPKYAKKYKIINSNIIYTYPEIIKFKKVDGEYKDVAVEVYDLCINIGNSLWGLELKE